MFKNSKSRKWAKMKERYNKGEIDAQFFVDAMKDSMLYYSTPLGDDKAGNSKLYLLSNRETECKYFPAFLSEEHCMQFFTKSGRNGFMIIQGNLGNFLSSLDSSPLLAALGAVIEPSFSDETTIPPGIRAR